MFSHYFDFSIFAETVRATVKSLCVCWRTDRQHFEGTPSLLFPWKKEELVDAVPSY